MLVSGQEEGGKEDHGRRLLKAQDRVVHGCTVSEFLYEVPAAEEMSKRVQSIYGPVNSHIDILKEEGHDSLTH